MTIFTFRISWVICITGNIPQIYSMEGNQVPGVETYHNTLHDEIIFKFSKIYFLNLCQNFSSFVPLNMETILDD